MQCEECGADLVDDAMEDGRELCPMCAHCPVCGDSYEDVNSRTGCGCN